MGNVNMEAGTKPVKEKVQKQAPIKQREINLVAALKAAKQNDKRAKKSGRPSVLVYVAGVIAVAIMAGAYISMYMKRDELTAENEDLEMTLFMQQDMVDEAEQQRLKRDYLKELDKNTREELLSLEEALSQYGYYGADIFDKIKGCSDGKITIDAIELENGQISLSLSAGSAADCAQYVQRLRKTELFDAIAYSGFDAGGEDGGASYSIVCHLDGAPVEGGED